MYQRLVVGYDGKERSQRAVQAAVELATSLGAVVHIVNAVPKDRLRDLDGGPERRAVDVDSSKVLLAELEDSIEYDAVTTASVKGAPADVVVAEAVRIDADLIVVGNKNVQGIGRVLGSVAEHIAKKAPCAVLIVNTA